MSIISEKILTLVKQREICRVKGDYKGADNLRDQIINEGYALKDNLDGSTEIKLSNETENHNALLHQQVVIFGSGELSTVGRSIHESLIKNLKPPVKISLLETPAGYEDNPHQWYMKLKDMMEKGLVDYKPEISLIPALRKEPESGTNDAIILSPLLSANYIHTGAGSPSYAVKHLQNSLAIRYMKKKLLEGTPLSIASAAAVAFGRYALPVYEIYFAGHDPSWIDGLDFFADWGLNITFIPHWNNKEGGANIDTRYAYMGQKRFNKLLSLIPAPTTIVGIDEHTALQLDFSEKKAKVIGKGTVTILRGTEKSIFEYDQEIKFLNLSG